MKPLTKREQKYIDRLRARCDVLRARISEGSTRFMWADEWKRELTALEWAIGKLTDPAVERGKTD